MRMVQYEGPNGLFNPPMWGTAWKRLIREQRKGTWYNYAVSRRADRSRVPRFTLRRHSSSRSVPVAQTQAGTQTK